jgi:hypothetical protein
MAAGRVRSAKAKICQQTECWIVGQPGPESSPRWRMASHQPERSCRHLIANSSQQSGSLERSFSGSGPKLLARIRKPTFARRQHLSIGTRFPDKPIVPFSSLPPPNCRTGPSRRLLAEAGLQDGAPIRLRSRQEQRARSIVDWCPRAANASWFSLFVDGIQSHGRMIPVMARPALSAAYCGGTGQSRPRRRRRPPSSSRHRRHRSRRKRAPWRRVARPRRCAGGARDEAEEFARRRRGPWETSALGQAKASSGASAAAGAETIVMERTSESENGSNRGALSKAPSAQTRPGRPLPLIRSHHPAPDA